MRRRILLFLAAACLLLAGCQRSDPPAAAEPPTPPAAVDPVPEDRPASEPRPIALQHLTVEVVVDWEEADRLLGSLEELSRLLEDALLSLDCTVEERVTITLSTAGGITAQALGDGGVDLAFLPEGDLTEMEGETVKILESPDGGLVAAVTAAEEDIGFALAEALTATEEGEAFIEICYPGAEFF